MVPIGTSATGKRPDGTKAQIGLQTAVRSDWPTPNAAVLTSDTTLTCSGDGREAPNKLGWAVAVEPEMWSTPTAHDAKHATCPPAALNRNTDDLAVQSGANKAAPLNPAWVATLMGFPSDWCDIPPLQAPRKGSPRTVGPWAVDSPKRRTNRRAPPTES